MAVSQQCCGYRVVVSRSECVDMIVPYLLLLDSGGISSDTDLYVMLDVVQFYFLEPTSSISIRNSTDKSKIEDRVLKERARRSIKIEPLVT